jgi:hypothetical protein
MLEVELCSVSAHSFLRKVEPGFNLNPVFFLAGGLVGYLTYLAMRHSTGFLEKLYLNWRL